MPQPQVQIDVTELLDELRRIDPHVAELAVARIEIRKLRELLGGDDGE